MSRSKKTYGWVLGSLGAALLFLLLLPFVLPKVVNLDALKEKVLANMAEAIEGEVLCETVALGVLPRPRLSLRQVKLSIPGKVSGSVDSASIYPRILPLFLGRVQAHKLKFKGPVLTLNLPPKQENGQKTESAWSAQSLEKQMVAGLKLMEEKAPGLKIRVKAGRLNLARGNKTAFWFNRIEGEVNPRSDRLEVSAGCESNLWKNMSFRGSMDAKGLESSGRLNFTELRLQPLGPYLQHLTDSPVEEGQVDLNVGFKTTGFESIEADVAGGALHLVFNHGSEKLVLKGSSLKGTFHGDEKMTVASLTELNLDDPKLSLSCNLTVDREAPRVALAVRGRDVDARATRKAALALAGRHATTRDIFDIIKGGKVPDITIDITGRSTADFDKLDNILIKGQMVEGEIFVPGALLDLEEASGNVVVSKGILQGKNLKARYGNSLGREGTLLIGLDGEDVPFTLDLLIDADLAQLPPVLERVVSDESFLNELRLIESFEGNASGRLSLGDRIKSVKTRLEVSTFNVTSRYGRVPYPMEMSGRDFLYEGSTIHVDDLNGRLGTSSCVDVCARLDWGTPSHLEIDSGPSSISMDEMFSWLSSFEEIKKAMSKLKSLTGTAKLSSLSLKGPFFSPEDWQFNTGGELENVAVDSDVTPETLTVTEGSFTATQEQLSFSIPPKTAFVWGETTGAAEGTLDYSSEEVLVDMDISADVLTWDQISGILEKRQKEESVEWRDRLWDLPVHGTLEVTPERFEYDQFKWHPIHVNMTFTGDGLRAVVSDAKLCGISTDGEFEITPAGTSIHFEPKAKNEPLEPALSCLTGEERPVTGHFDFTGTVSTQEQKTDIVKSLEGKVRLHASDGRIYRYGAIAKILNLLNVEGVLRGELPKIKKEGFPYQSIKAKGHLEKGKLIVDEGVLDSHSMNMVFEGKIDLEEATINMTVLVAPLKTADWVIEKIPLVNYILQDTLVTIPYKVKGDLKDPDVTPLSPSAVGGRLLGIVKRTVQLPFKAVGIPLESMEAPEDTEPEGLQE